MADGVEFGGLGGLGGDVNNEIKNQASKQFMGQISELINQYMWIAVILLVIKVIAITYAMYLAYKCKNGFNLLQFLLACCCWCLYIPYRLAVPCKNKGVADNANKVKSK
jgi:Na+/H+-dicarboxylate symporter